MAKSNARLDSCSGLDLTMNCSCFYSTAQADGRYHRALSLLQKNHAGSDAHFADGIPPALYVPSLIYRSDPCCLSSGDLNNNSRDGMMRVLGASCGGGAPPPLDQAHFMDPVVLSTKYLHTILMNPEWGDWYPVPAVAGEVETNINQLSINGEAVQVSNGSAWVDVGLLQAGRDTLEDKDLSMWLTKQSTALLPQILAAFGSGSIRPRVKDNWTSQALAPQVLGNLKFIMQQMTAVDDSVFAQIAGPCFDPDALLDMFRRWENMDGSPALPSPSNTLV
eukprot:TRINITY_DN11795_c1_g3_i21.p2 TRINITY_DN11795_c1_g3~~TRINITY_DN11795_c1_g3_i21.p2  ORF type:complete len:278 (+),score=50.21 TRINITY_DN11795_c1_g3_i21:3626-4459(+)